MSELTYRAADATAQSSAYVESLFAALGSRDPIEVLTEMPSALRNAVARLTSKQEQTPEREGKWSVRHVVQHLADSELVGAFRYRMVLAHDAPALPGYDQDAWADRLRYADTDIPTALGDFAALRLMNLRLLRRATPLELRRVMRHAERGEESLQTMLRMYAGHDIVHLRQILRIRQAIGAAGQA